MTGIKPRDNLKRHTLLCTASSNAVCVERSTNVYQASDNVGAEEHYVFIRKLKTMIIRDIARPIVPRQLAPSIMIGNLVRGIRIRLI